LDLNLLSKRGNNKEKKSDEVRVLVFAPEISIRKVKWKKKKNEKKEK
jgi:hypothetical protein